MSKALNAFLMSGKLKESGPGLLAVYLTLRADAETAESATAKLGLSRKQLVSGLTVQSVADLTGLIYLTVKRHFDDISKLGWGKRIAESPEVDYMQLGEIDYKNEPLWWVDKVPVEGRDSGPRFLSPSEMIRKKVLEDRKLAEEKAKEHELSILAKKRIAGGVIPEELKAEKADSSKIVAHFNGRFRQVFRESGPHSSRDGGVTLRKAYVLANRVLPHAEFDCVAVIAVIDYMMDNWAALCGSMKLDGLPSLNLLANKGLFDRIRWAMLGKSMGKKSDAVAKRYDAEKSKASPDYGWGD